MVNFILLHHYVSLSSTHHKVFIQLYYPRGKHKSRLAYRFF